MARRKISVIPNHILGKKQAKLLEDLIEKYAHDEKLKILLDRGERECYALRTVSNSTQLKIYNRLLELYESEDS